MNILVTGATGFVGRHLLGALERAGHHVSIVSRQPHVGFDWTDESLREGITRTLLGEGATVLLTGQEVAPRRALEAGFTFEHPELEQALRDLLEKTPALPHGSQGN